MEMGGSGMIAALFAVLMFVMFRRFQQKTSRLPPGPQGWPVIGSLASLGANPHRSFRKISEKYGPIFLLWLGHVPTVVVSSPEICKEVFKVQDLNFSDRPSMAAAIMAYDGQDLAWSNYGDWFRYLKRIAVTDLLTPKRLQTFQNVRNSEIGGAILWILEESKLGKPVNMRFKLTEVMFNAISRMILGKGFFGPTSGAIKESLDFQHVLHETFSMAGLFHLADFFPALKRFDLQGYEKRMRAVMVKLDALFQSIIDEHKDRLTAGDFKKDPDFVDVMLTTPSLDGEGCIPEVHIKSVLNDMMMAGTETSASTTEWNLSALMKNPKLMKKAVDEIDAVVGRDRLVEESDLPKLIYLQAVVAESFRLYPAGPLLIPHQNRKACELGGYHIPAKTRLFVNTWALGRDPATWERAEEFDPERFIDPETNTVKDAFMRGQDFNLLPFGSGRRMCPGAGMGTLLVKITLARCLQLCTWELPPGEKPEDMDMTELFGLASPRAQNLVVIAKPRLPLLLAQLSNA